MSVQKELQMKTRMRQSVADHSGWSGLRRLVIPVAAWETDPLGALVRLVYVLQSFCEDSLLGFTQTFKAHTLWLRGSFGNISLKNKPTVQRHAHRGLSQCWL